MRSESMLSVESHRSAATMYLTGELTTAGVMRAIAQADQLPENVRALCLDLRGVRRADSYAMRVLEIGLRDWRSTRRGMSRVKLPDSADAGLIALKFPHQRWTQRAQVRVAETTKPVGIRIRDSRQAVVTRSLRERAASETR